MRKTFIPTLPEGNGTLVEAPLVQAVASEVPGLGAVVTYLVETVREEREDRLRGFLSDLSAGFDDLERRVSESEELIDRKHVDSPEFRAAIVAATEEAIRSPDETKVKYLRDFLLSYSRLGRPDRTLTDEYWSILRALSGTHCLILAWLFRLQGRKDANDLRDMARDPTHPDSASVRQVAKELGLGESLVDAIAIALRSRGVLWLVAPPSPATDNSERLVLSPLGASFFRFLTS